MPNEIENLMLENTKSIKSSNTTFGVNREAWSTVSTKGSVTRSSDKFYEASKKYATTKIAVLGLLVIFSITILVTELYYFRNEGVVEPQIKEIADERITLQQFRADSTNASMQLVQVSSGSSIAEDLVLQLNDGMQALMKDFSTSHCDSGVESSEIEGLTVSERCEACSSRYSNTPGLLVSGAEAAEVLGKKCIYLKKLSDLVQAALTAKTVESVADTVLGAEAQSLVSQYDEALKDFMAATSEHSWGYTVLVSLTATFFVIKFLLTLTLLKEWNLAVHLKAPLAGLNRQASHQRNVAEEKAKKIIVVLETIMKERMRRRLFVAMMLVPSMLQTGLKSKLLRQLLKVVEWFAWSVHETRRFAALYLAYCRSKDHDFVVDFTAFREFMDQVIHPISEIYKKKGIFIWSLISSRCPVEVLLNKRNLSFSIVQVLNFLLEECGAKQVYIYATAKKLGFSGVAQDPDIAMNYVIQMQLIGFTDEDISPESFQIDDKCAISKDGKGMGLIIAQRALNAMGGELTISYDSRRIICDSSFIASGSFSNTTLRNSLSPLLEKTFIAHELSALNALQVSNFCALVNIRLHSTNSVVKIQKFISSKKASQIGVIFYEASNWEALRRQLQNMRVELQDLNFVELQTPKELKTSDHGARQEDAQWMNWVTQMKLSVDYCSEEFDVIASGEEQDLVDLEDASTGSMLSCLAKKKKLSQFLGSLAYNFKGRMAFSIASLFRTGKSDGNEQFSHSQIQELLSEKKSSVVQIEAPITFSSVLSALVKIAGRSFKFAGNPSSYKNVYQRPPPGHKSSATFQLKRYSDSVVSQHISSHFSSTGRISKDSIANKLFYVERSSSARNSFFSKESFQRRVSASNIPFEVLKKRNFEVLNNTDKSLRISKTQELSETEGQAEDSAAISKSKIDASRTVTNSKVEKQTQREVAPITSEIKQQEESDTHHISLPSCMGGLLGVAEKIMCKDICVYRAFKELVLGAPSTRATEDSSITDTRNFLEIKNFRNAKGKDKAILQSVDENASVEAAHQHMKSGLATIKKMVPSIKVTSKCSEWCNTIECLNAKQISLEDLTKISKSIDSSGARPEKQRTWEFDALSMSSIECVQHATDLLVWAKVRSTIPEVASTKLALLSASLHFNYNSVRYHNFRHALTVTEILAILLNHSEIQSHFSDIGIFHMIFAALGHDVDHPGVTNEYLISSLSLLSTLYNDRAVLESHHASILFEIARDPKVDLFAEWEPIAFRNMKKRVVRAIIATDTKCGYSLAEKLQHCCEMSRKQLLRPLSLILDELDAVLLHAATMCEPLLPFEISSEWGYRAYDELYCQKILEMKVGISTMTLPAAAIDGQAIAEAQLDYIDRFSSPIIFPLSELFPGLFTNRIQVLEESRKRWKALALP